MPCPRCHSENYESYDCKSICEECGEVGNEDEFEVLAPTLEEQAEDFEFILTKLAL